MLIQGKGMFENITPVLVPFPFSQVFRLEPYSVRSGNIV